MLKSRFRRFLEIVSSPFVFAGVALAAVVVVLWEMFTAGRKSERVRELKQEGKDEQAKIDKLESGADAAGLRDDILRRTRDILK